MRRNEARSRPCRGLSAASLLGRLLVFSGAFLSPLRSRFEMLHEEASQRTVPVAKASRNSVKSLGLQLRYFRRSSAGVPSHCRTKGSEAGKLRESDSGAAR